MNQVTKAKLKHVLPVKNGLIISTERWAFGEFKEGAITKMWAALMPYLDKRDKLWERSKSRRKRRGFNPNYVKLPF